MKPYENNLVVKNECRNHAKTIVLAALVAQTLQKQVFWRA